ncbi:copper amine oxidase N-terminal domain-containing protein [Agathobaculum sp.]|uniref:copper amine oxidase N-terminal domain-containing protein n=1 Tax=Agathobaculum sp. TaxID=2048138 RepID=UPI003AB255BB
MKHKRLLTAALAASLAVSSLPAALALDTAPPMYQQFGYDSVEAYTSSYDWWFDKFSYDQASDCYRRHLDEIHSDPSVALRFHDAEQSDLEEWLDSGYWDDREAFYRSTALDMTLQDDLYAVPALSVQLSGKTLTFPDVQPFFENGRTMVPFRTVAEALGAEVGYDSGTVSASLDGTVCRFAIGGDTLTVSDRVTGKVLKTVPLDASPIEKDGRTCVPVRFLAESLGLTVEWDDGAQCAVLYDRDALLESIDSGFTTANRWLAAVPRLQNTDAVRMGLTAKLDCTAFDTISGDKKYSVSGTMTLVSDGKSASLSASADLSALAGLLSSDLISSADGPTSQLFSASMLSYYKSALGNAAFDLIYNADTDTLYVRSPLLFSALASSSGTDKKADGWYYEEHFSEKTALGDLLTLYRNADTPNTCGAALLASAEAYAEEYGGWSGFYSSLEDRQQSLSAVLGDAVFTRSGDRCTAQPSVKSLLGGEEDDMVGVSGSYTLNTATGAASGDLILDIKGSLFPVANRTRLTFDFSGTSGRMTLSNHLRNQGTLTFDLSLSLAPSSAPVSAPPKDAVLTPLDELN